jgi:hypothetical protein
MNRIIFKWSLCFYILFVGNGIQSFADSSKDDVNRFEGDKNIRDCFGICVPKLFIFLATFCIVSVGSVGQQGK